MSCVGARANVVVPKMISRDCPCVFCTFVWLICLMLPPTFIQVVCPWKPKNFFRVVHPRKHQISFGRVGTCRVWVPMQTGQVASGRVVLCHVTAPRAHVAI